MAGAEPRTAITSGERSHCVTMMSRFWGFTSFGLGGRPRCKGAANMLHDCFRNGRKVRYRDPSGQRARLARDRSLVEGFDNPFWIQLEDVQGDTHIQHGNAAGRVFANERGADILQRHPVVCGDGPELDLGYGERFRKERFENDFWRG
jgi:hypothetical protein